MALRNDHDYADESKTTRVLIIDDSPLNLTVLENSLSELGWQITTVRSGEQGLIMLQSFQPDVILLDIVMPGMDGFEACHLYKRLPKIQKIPIIFISTLSDKDSRIKGFNLGAVDYICRPYVIEEVISRIQNQVTIAQLKQESEKRDQDLKMQSLENRLLRQVCEHSPVSIIITNALGLTTYVNPKFEEISGYSAAEIRGKNPRLLKSGQMSMLEYETLWQTISNGEPWHGEFHNRRKNGELYWEKASISPLINDQGQITHYIGIKEDITHLKDQEKLLFQQNYYDTLTGLPNRVLIKEQLHQAIQEAKSNGHRVGVIVLDLDNIKKVNNTLSYEIGDRLLKEISHRLQLSLRASDTIGHLGCDEFLIIVSNFKYDMEVIQISERVLTLLRQPITLAGQDISLWGNLGIATFPEDGHDEDDVIRNADTAMYGAKSEGQNTYRFFSREQ